MKRSAVARISIMITSLIIIVGSVLFTSELINGKLKAAGTTTDVNIIQAQFYGENSTIAGYAVSEKGELWESANSFITPYTRVKGADGRILTNIKKVVTQNDTNLYKHNYFRIALTNDGQIYAWGEGGSGQLGDGNSASKSLPTLINTGVSGKIIDVAVGHYNTYILMENGDLYATGAGELGNGTNTASASFVKVDVSNVKQVTPNSENCFALDGDGTIWAWGHLPYGTGSSTTIVPTKLKNADGSEFQTKAKLLANDMVVASEYYSGSQAYVGGGVGLVFVGVDNELYYLRSGLGNIMGEYSLYPKKVIFDYPDLSNISYLTGGFYNLSAVIDGTLYGISDPVLIHDGLYDPTSNQVDQNNRFYPYIKGGIANGTRVLSGSQTYASAWAIREDKRLFIKGQPAQFKIDLEVNASTQAGYEYEDSQKYSANVYLDVTKSTDFSSYAIKYKVKDLLTNTVSEVKTYDEDESLTVKAISDQRIYQEYEFYIDGREDETAVYFTVDLYKHDYKSVIDNRDVIEVKIDNQELTNNGHFPTQSEIVWDGTNGLSGNSVKASLTLPVPIGSPAGTQPETKDIVNNYNVGANTGTYSLKLEDEYKNIFSNSFYIDAAANPTGVILTDAGEFAYNNEYTKKGERLGELTLKYNVGDTANEISELRINSGDTGNYFKVEQDSNSKKWYLVANETIPVGDYSLTFSGKAGIRTFTKQLKTSDDSQNRIITISIADNPMIWNDVTNLAITNGMFIDGSLTVGISNKPEEIGSVTYSIEPAVTGVSIDPATGVLTITSMSEDSQAVTIVAKTERTNNYKEKNLTGTITLSKQSINLKTVIVKDDANKDNIILDLGSPVPEGYIEATTTLPNGVTLANLKPDKYKLIRQSDTTETEVTDLSVSGTYEIRPVYTTSTNLNKYKIIWDSYATITANKVTISDENASAYYTLTLEDSANTTYIPGTWTNKNIVITPRNSLYNNMKVNTGSYQTTAKTFTTEGDNTISLTFKTAAGIETSVRTINNVKIDRTKPVMNAITFSDQETSTLANLLRAFSFGTSKAKAQTATFSGTDISGSGISAYHYDVTEIDDNGEDIKIYESGDGSSVDLEGNKNYKIKVYAIDNAGNTSDVKTETIKINNTAPEINVDAKIKGTTTVYNGEWTSKEIEVNLSSNQDINGYAWSTDAATYTAFEGTKYIISNTQNIDNTTYTFKGTSLTGITGTKDISVKIDTTVPKFEIHAVDVDGDSYNGTNTEKDVIINLSQSDAEKNISGVKYYYCSNSSIKDTNPVTSPTGWTSVVGNQATFNSDTNTIYYFKAVSGAGVASSATIPQTINITKIVDNPDDLVWATQGDQEVTYGTSIPLTITLGGVEVDASEIEIIATGGNQCLTYENSTRTVKAISGTCLNGVNGSMTISAKVGNYRNPLTKTITAKKAELQLQTKFVVNNVPSNTASILKDGNIPALSVDFVANKGLVSADASLVINASDLGDFIPEYSNSVGTILPVFKTDTIGTFSIKNKLQTNSVTEIANFSSKYNVVTLAGTLNIGDNNYSDDELYEIVEQPNDNGWYANKVTILPKHSVFNKMSIDGGERKEGEQIYPSGEIINGSNDVILKFVDASGNTITKNPTIKIDNLVPDLMISASSNGANYNGDKTENDVAITLSQPQNNASGVTYYYCTDVSTSASNPTGSGWTKLTDRTKTFAATENNIYYFKAVSGAGLVSTEAKSQKIFIEKKDPNPIDMDWKTGFKEDLAYGDIEQLAINNTNGNDITYTSSGGEGCLSLDAGVGEVKATSGVCLNGDMVVSAQVGNYATPLKKTFSAHKVNLDFQTIFTSDNTKTKTIFKGDSEPTVKVELINGTALAGAEAGLKINDIGNYTKSYSLNGGSTTSGISTDTTGQYKITSKLNTSSVTFNEFNSKYAIHLQEPATLNINDTNFTADQLFTIEGNHVNDEWFTNVVTITPIHDTFNRMSIDGGVVTTGAQLYPGSGSVNVDKTINITFTNSAGSPATINGIPIKIDSVKPTFSIVAQSNNIEYISGSSTMYDVDVNFSATSSNISGIGYLFTKDVLSNGNVKPDATWIECGRFTISESGTYYMKAISGAGLESDVQKFVARIDKPDTTKKPTVAVTSNNKPIIADGTTWARNDVTFKLAGNTTGYEVCVSTDKDRSVDCDDQSYNWTTIDDETNSIHSVTQDQDQTYYWFRNKLPGFQTTASEAYIVMLDSVVPDTPQITVTEKQNALMALFARSSGTFHNKAVDVAIDAQDDRSGIASITYDIYDVNGKLLKENQSYTEVLTYEDTNIQISAKAIDNAGNITEVSDLTSVSVDTIAPQISGVKDEASYYVPYLFISYQDNGSGIDATNTTYTNNDKTEELLNNTLFNGKGNVSVNVQDLAGNTSSISFEMLGLPEHTDCSAQSMQLIDTVKAQYDDVKGHLNDTQKKEITDWMAKVNNSCSITDPDHNVTVENPDAKIPENTVLVVDVITTTIDDVELSLEKNEEVKVAYDVYFKKGETVFKDLEGSEMKVKLPLGAIKGSKGLRLVSVEKDGKAKTIAYVSEGEYAVFTTSELKRYAFIAEKSTDPNINVDTDCDGTPDINIDTDEDGIPDINIDTTGDGKANYNIDIDDDKIPDVNIGPIDWNPDKCITTPCGKVYCTSTYYKPYLNIDSDGDQRPDINVDLDKDMEADINIDTDFDDIPNIDIDSDGDGKADINIDNEGDGKADQNLLDLKEWKPELNVDIPFKYDTMAGLKADARLSDGDDSTDDSTTSNKDQDNKNQDNKNQDDKDQNKQVAITPTVKGSYTSSLGGAMTGEANSLPILFIMLCSSTFILWRRLRKGL